MNPFIFRREDIRGVFETDFDAKDSYCIGQAFATWVKERGETKILVGRDNRLSSDTIFKNFSAGVQKSGSDVLDLGLVTTPMVYFARQRFSIPAAVEITGSHNPPHWNGFKLCFSETTTLYGQDVQDIRKICETKKFKDDLNQGKLKTIDVVTPYNEALRQSITETKKIKNPKKLKVVVDSGNGLGGPFTPHLLRELGCEVVELHSRPDGTFPNHLADPAVEANMVELCAKVKETKADVGIAFDGDVDRINAVNEKGEILYGDGLIVLYARDILKNHPGAEILFNSQCSPAVAEDISTHGGKPMIVPTGHSLVSHQLEKSGGLFAGEYKGHMFFRDHFLGFDDAIYAALRLVLILQDDNRVLSEILFDVPYYKSTGEIMIPTSDEKKFIIEEKVREELKKRYFVQDLEGDTRVKFGDDLPDTWGLVRNSDTTPNVEVYAWAKDQDNMQKGRNILVDEVKKWL